MGALAEVDRRAGCVNLNACRDRIAAAGRLCAGEDQAERTDFCRGDDPANARSRIRQDAKGLAVSLCRDDRPFGGIGPPMVAYRFEDSRGGECVERHLVGFTGILHVDGYAAYNRRARSAGANEGVTLAACFAQRQETVLRASRQRELAPGDPDRHHHGRAVGDRGRHPRPGS